MRLVALPPDSRKKLPKIRRPKSAAEKRAIKIRKARRLARQRAAAATVIQCACRQFLARRILKDLRENAAATIIQMCWRRMQFRQRVNLKKTSAIKIQCRFRIFMARKHMHALRVAYAQELCKAATVIQTAIRGHLARQELHRLQVRHAERQRNGAICIQSNWRGSRVRGLQLIAKKRAIRDNRAAHVIQSLFRQYAYREHRRRDKEESARVAATRIQRLFRGNVGRERYLRIRAEHNAKEAMLAMKEADIVAAVDSSTLSIGSAVYARALQGIVYNRVVSDYITKRELFYKYVRGHMRD